MKYLGIDYGQKRVGVAVSDSFGKIAFPKKIIENSEKLVDEINKIIETESVEKVVVGDSKNYQLKDNPIMKDIKRFSKDVEVRSGVSVEFHPEFMSTMQAEKIRQLTVDRYNKNNKTKARFKGKSLDDSAAAIILQSYLDTKND